VGWEERKANVRKHGIAFAEAADVFSDLLSITIPDIAHSDCEDRLLTVGKSRSGRTVVVAHTERGHIVRIISARLATTNERSKYEEGD
jgi:uncharacterized DUF497 family protein